MCLTSKKRSLWKVTLFTLRLDRRHLLIEVPAPPNTLLANDKPIELEV
jgi:hypothetical protein